MISAQCPECQSDVNSNKRGCGSPAQAQASARVDVPTARVFPAWTMESNMSASFCVDAWMCAPQATDRDPQSFNVNAWKCARRTTDRDPESFCVNDWICTCQATDRDLQSVSVKRKVNARICAQSTTDRDLETKKWMLGYVHRGQPTMILHSIKICIICNVCNFFMQIYCFGIKKSVIFVI